MAEVVTKGKTFREERIRAKGNPFPDMQLTDQELTEKFRHNATRILAENNIKNALDTLLNLEELKNIAELMEQLAPRGNK